ncbi:MAG: catalase family peroxidase [Lysobacter sp.]
MPPREPPAQPKVGRYLPALAAIAAIIGAVVLLFAWVGGWLAPGRLTPQAMADAIQTANGNVYPGYRRAHAKGVCVSGYFESNGEGQALSKAGIFKPGRSPLLGRMSIGGGAPHGMDGSARVRSMALQLVDDNGHEWRMAMNSFPFFAVSSVRAFYEQSVASAPDPATGKPDPAKMAAFAKAHPESANFAHWAKTAPWSNSFANTRYNGVNTFRFDDAGGGHRHVRWSMQPEAAFEEMTADQRAAADADFLADDLAQRLAQGPLRWDMVVTIGGPDDSITDPSQVWPESAPQVAVGKVVIERSEPQTTGACRDVNFDPLILPPGVDGSEDPILAARSAVYSVSFNRRERDIAAGHASEATGQAPAEGATP